MKKLLLTLAAGWVSTTSPLGAAPEISDRSPDRAYALSQEYADKQPYHGDVKLIETKTQRPILTLDTQVGPFSKRLLWSKDSQRFAYFNDSEARGVTRLFFRKHDSFDEVKVPDLPRPPLPNAAAGQDDSEARVRVEPLRWTDAGSLVVENEIISEKWGRTALEVTLTFDPQQHATVADSKPEPPSIIDYFLLMPANQFEGPPASWFHLMRANGNTIDRKNGYMSCPGDGAQPEFEAALFRYRDGRPLLVLCSGELEGADSVSLEFFELAPNGQMQKINRWILPVPDGGYDPETGWTKANWQFKIPRSGKTITIQSQKGHRVLHKLTWNGDRFEEEK